MLIPSLLLWRRVLDESRELTLWERIRRAVSLIVDRRDRAGTRARGGASGLARAGTAAGGQAGVLIVLDSSWSMLARTRSGETRWDRARRARPARRPRRAATRSRWPRPPTAWSRGRRRTWR